MTRHVTEDLGSVFAPKLVEALTRLVDERVERALADRDIESGSPWLSLAEAAGRLRVSERTVARLVERGRIRTTALGRRRLVRVEDLDEAAREGSASHPPRRRRSVDRRRAEE
jgi:excisionase family DNA binding protein